MMNRVCPTCGRSTADPTPRFCDRDGSAYVAGTSLAGTSPRPPGGSTPLGSSFDLSTLLLWGAGLSCLAAAIWLVFDGSEPIDVGATQAGQTADGEPPWQADPRPDGPSGGLVGVAAPVVRPESAAAMLEKCYGATVPGVPQIEGRGGSEFGLAKDVLAIGVGVGAAVLGQPPSAADEQRIADEIEEQLVAKFGRSRDTGEANRLRRIAARLAAIMPSTDRSYSFRLLASNDRNAMMTPGGRGYVFEGIVKAMPEDGPLAFVIAHELAHDALGHQDATLRLAMAGRALGQGLGAEGERLGEMAATIASKVLELAYDQDKEYESDRMAVCALHLAGYDRRAAIRALEALQAPAGDLELVPARSGGARVLYDVVATHPPVGDRIRYARRLIGATVGGGK